jgi:citrate synthase
LSADESPVRDSTIQTELASSDVHHIWVRGRDLSEELMGVASFAEVVFLLMQGRMPQEHEAKVVDAILVALMEHGLTPSAVVARMTHAVAPESLQGAVAAGLLGAGSVVLGSMEECGHLLTRVDQDVSAGASQDAAIEAAAAEYRRDGRRIPGVGHVVHTDGDPRAARLFMIAQQVGLASVHVDRMQRLALAAGAAANRPLPVNVTGATAALLMELGIPWRLHKGFALISRAAGLVAHVAEELESPIVPALRGIIRDGDRARPSGAANGQGRPR